MSISVQLFRSEIVENQSVVYGFTANGRVIVNPKTKEPIFLKEAQTDDPALYLELQTEDEQTVKVTSADYVSQIGKYLEDAKIYDSFETSSQRDSFFKSFVITARTTVEKNYLDSTLRFKFLISIFKRAINLTIASKRERSESNPAITSVKKRKQSVEPTDRDLATKVVHANVKKVKLINNSKRREPYSFKEQLMIHKTSLKAIEVLKESQK